MPGEAWLQQRMADTCMSPVDSVSSFRCVHCSIAVQLERQALPGRVINIVEVPMVAVAAQKLLSTRTVGGELRPQLPGITRDRSAGFLEKLLGSDP